MNNLINITNQNGNLVASSREVAINFDKSNSVVNRSIENLIEETSMQNCTHLFIESIYKDSYEREQKEFLLTRDGFSLLVMGFTGSKSLEWKLKYIEAFNKMEKVINEQNYLPQLDSKFLFQIAQKIEEQEKQIALMKPKVIFAEALEISKSSILVGEMAKLLARNGLEDVGQNRFFAWLRVGGYLHKSGEQYNLPTQYSTELEIIEVKTTTINNPDGSTRVTKTPKITVKGQIYFINKFKDKEIA